MRRPLAVALSWLPVVAYTLLIWVLSSQTVSIDMLEGMPMHDKGVHFLEYGALGFFTAHAMHVTWPARRLRLMAAAWLSLGLGLTDELHQVYVPGRSGDSLDLIADALGIGVAVLSYGLLSRLHARRAARLTTSASRP